MATAAEWLIGVFIFAIGYVVGRVVTTIQYGIKFNSDAKTAKKDFVKKFSPKKTKKK